MCAMPTGVIEEILKLKRTHPHPSHLMVPADREQELIDACKSILIEFNDVPEITSLPISVLGLAVRRTDGNMLRVK
jgi:hypothetical protein